jgi:hypothetical protein
MKNDFLELEGTQALCHAKVGRGDRPIEGRAAKTTME